MKNLPYYIRQTLKLISRFKLTQIDLYFIIFFGCQKTCFGLIYANLKTFCFGEFDLLTKSEFTLFAW